MRHSDPFGPRPAGHFDDLNFLPDEFNNPDLDPARLYRLTTTFAARGLGPAVPIAPAAPSPATVAAAGAAAASPFVINVIWDASVSSAPSGFMTAIQTAVQYLESQFTDPLIININVGYGEVGGSSLGSLGASESALTSVGYAQLRAALAADSTTATDRAVLASLPASSPVSGTYWLTFAQARALGLMPASTTNTDGSVGFSSTVAFTYAGTVAPGTYDFNGVALHEITEVMRRMLFDNTSIGSTANSYDLMDLMHYSSPGVRDFSGSTPGYFSVDGGVTNLGNFNTVNGGDTGDWAASVPNNAFDAFSYSGVVNAATDADLTLLDALGWNRVVSGGNGTPPAGVSFSPATASLNNLQAGDGLAAGTALATITETGGKVADAFSYSLGGAGAGSFALSNSSNAATLSNGASGAAGTANGELYALAVTATDTTSGATAPATALDVIAGSSGGDAIQVSALAAGLGSGTPAFIYGLAGSDTINGAAMTGKLWLDGGAGADLMTGGSGPNDYLYGSTSDSTGSAMDIITNFHPATDVVDLSGLGASVRYVGQFSGGGLSSHFVGWQSSGGNTFVYVNTSGLGERLSAIDMKIELQGIVTLSSANIVRG